MGEIKTIVIAPIDVDELTPGDLATGMTQARKAVLSATSRSGKMTQCYDVPAEGCTIVCNPPLKAEDTYIQSTC